MSKPDRLRNKDGTFRKGVSGNPGGRSGDTAVLREKLASGSDDVVAVVLEKARAGDMQAARLILERIVPAVKPVSDPVKFDIDATDLPSSARSILSAIAAGQIPPDQGKALIDAVASMARVVEVAELEQQLAELREMMESRL